VNKLEISQRIIASIKQDSILEFERLADTSNKNRYTEEQKQYVINLVLDIGIRATSKRLDLHRKTVRRWLESKNVKVKRCPEWVYTWASNRRKNKLRRTYINN
tara:strand:- start:338 stop:646 length:309 start_codon:yes stop_codon:yes gene_type:complete